MYTRLHAVTLRAISDRPNICLRCAEQLAQFHQPRIRRFSRKPLLQQAVADGKALDVNKKFFWANVVRSDHQSTDRSIASYESQADSTARVKDEQRLGEHKITFAQAAEEKPHRRRKRLKAAASGVDDAGDVPLPLDASSQLSQDAAAAPARSFRRIVSTYLALTKPRLAFLIVLTTTASYSIYPVPALLSTVATDAPSLSTLTLLFLTTGTFSCISSANTLNMLFEPKYDAQMSRTRNRPLVRGLVSKRAALIFAVATGVLGTGLLWYGVNPTTAILGASNIGLYAFAYTFLKRVHPVNTWVGAIVGAIPPMMGWCAAASQYSTARASSPGFTSVWEESKELLFTEQAIGGWLLAALLFAWQFPHFFALSYGIRHEYATAGYKMLTSSNVPMAARVSLRYSFAMFPICAGLSYYAVTDPTFAATSGIINAWMLKEAVQFWRKNGEKGSARALFWASVWQLPIVLVLAMIHKKGLWERIWQSIYGEPDTDLDMEWEEDDD